MLSDLVLSWLRMRVGAGHRPAGRAARLRVGVSGRSAAWPPWVSWPGVAGRGTRRCWPPCCRSAGLLAVFARERRGRIENALALQRLAQESRDRLQSIVQNSSDCIVIVDADGAMRTLTGSVSRSSAPTGSADGTRCSTRASSRRRRGRRVPGGGGRPSRPDEPQEAEWRMRYADGCVPAHRRRRHQPSRRPHGSTGIVITARDVEERKALRGATAPPRVPRRPHRAGQPRAVLRPGRARARPRRPRRQPGRRPVRRPRRLQADQRRPRPCRGRSAAAGGRASADSPVCARPTPRRGSAATSSACCSRASPIRAVPARRPRASSRRWRSRSSSPTAAASVSASIGIAISAAEDRGVEEFLRKADLAMYEAKRNGKRRAELYDARLERARRPGRPRGHGSRATTSNAPRSRACSPTPTASTMVFQPIMDLRTGRRRRLRVALALQPRAPPRAQTSGSPRRTAAGSATRWRPRPSPPHWRRPGRPDGTLSDLQPQPVVAALRRGAARPARAPRRPRRRDHRERARLRRPGHRAAHSPTCARAARASPSTTPAPATRD